MSPGLIVEPVPYLGLSHIAPLPVSRGDLGRSASGADCWGFTVFVANRIGAAVFQDKVPPGHVPRQDCRVRAGRCP